MATEKRIFSRKGAKVNCFYSMLFFFAVFASWRDVSLFTVSSTVVGQPPGHGDIVPDAQPGQREVVAYRVFGPQLPE